MDWVLQPLGNYAVGQAEVEQEKLLLESYGTEAVRKDCEQEVDEEGERDGKNSHNGMVPSRSMSW